MGNISTTGGNPALNSAQRTIPGLRLPSALSLRGPGGAAETSRLSAPRTSDSVSLRPGLADAAAGIATIERSFNAARQEVDQLDQVGELLAELRGLVAAAGRGNAGAELADIQARVDSIIGTISQTEAAGTRFNPQPAALGLGYQIQNVLPGVATNATGYASFAPGQTEIDVEVQIVASAQQGGFYLSLGAGNLNLSGGTGFTIEVAGAKGVRMFTFISGTSTTSIAQAINQFSNRTGVVAKQFGPDGYLSTGLQLRSSDFGDDAFVSVRVLESGNIDYAPGHAHNVGIYRLIENSSNTVDTGSRMRFWQGYGGVTDHGQDVEALINGVQAQVSGNRLSANGENWRIAFELSPLTTQTSPAPFVPLKFVSTAAREHDASTSQQILDDFAESLGTQRAQATARLESAREQLRAALRTLPGADSLRDHQQTLAELRSSLLNSKSR